MAFAHGEFVGVRSAGRAELEDGLRTWHRYVDEMGRVLGAPTSV